MTTKHTAADLLTDLVGALDSAFISTWQSTADWQQQLDLAKEHLRAERIRDAAPELLAALKDMLSGWKYIRESHGDLYGVGWDRAQDNAEDAIRKATGEQT